MVKTSKKFPLGNGTKISRKMLENNKNEIKTQKN